MPKESVLGLCHRIETLPLFFDHFLSRCPTRLAALAMMCSILSANPAEAARPEPGSIGINVYAVYNWGEQIPFIDIFKQSGPWSGGYVDIPGDNFAPKLDSNGWVTDLDAGQYAETTIFTGSGGHYPAGRYTVLYEGKGKLTVTGDGVTTAKSEPGKILLNVQPTTGGRTNGLHIRESELDPKMPITNIRVFLPGYSEKSPDGPFNPAFVNSLKPFKVLRFIGWSHVSRSETVDWADERPVTYATQASAVTERLRMTGVSLEYQIQLANLLHADPWFLVPLKASDDFVEHMAKLVHTTLDPGLHPYVEVSNEVWNAHFPEGGYARQIALQENLDPDPVKAAAKWFARRSVHVFDLWNRVYGVDSGRIVRILGSAYPLPPITQTELAFEDTSKKVDAVAIAPYISPKSLNDYNAVAQMTPDQVLDKVQDDVEHKFKDFMGYHLSFTRKYGVDLVAYEGGPGLFSPDAPPELLPKILKTLSQANHSPRMATIYRELLDEWFAAGGTLFNHFNDVSLPNKWGMYGLLDYQYQDPATSPDYQMLLDYSKTKRGAQQFHPPTLP